jgi:hypothetical protein
MPFSTVPVFCLGKANILNDQLTSVFSHELPGEVPTKGVSPHSAVPDINITASGVLKLLRNTNLHTATMILQLIEVKDTGL